MPELWVPGAAGPSIEDFVDRLHQQIEKFSAGPGQGAVAVEFELHDGSLVQLASISPEPGYGFLTLCPHCEEGEPEELIVPVGSIRRIRLSAREEHLRFGFSVPEKS